MQQVERHAESDDLLFCIQILEIERLVALVAVNYEEPMCSHCAHFCVLIEVLEPRNSMYICCSAVVADSNDPIMRYEVVVIPGADVGFLRKDDVR